MITDYLDEAIQIVDALEGSELYHYVASLFMKIDRLEGRPKTKKTRYGKPWHYECPECGVSADLVPQLNFKNRVCTRCGWNDFGMDPEMMVQSYQKSRS